MSDKLYPVYTLDNKCLDCYKCVRECFTKSIQVINSQARVMSDKCIACGHCVRVCPQHAKKVRSDIEKVKELIASGKKVIASLAPSWAGIFDYTPEQMIRILKDLGFFGVSETAIGAEFVSIQTAKILNKMDKGLLISSACPVIVDYILKYKSEYAPFLAKTASPALTHAKFLKEQFEDIAVVFIGPCIAKKNESDKHPDLLDVALTFEELTIWMKQSFVDLNSIIPDESDTFIPKKAHEGGYYPMEGGMNETIILGGIKENVHLVTSSSIPALKRALNNLNVADIKDVVFLEALSCPGGCINGPSTPDKRPSLVINSSILSKIKTRNEIPKEPDVVLEFTHEIKNEDNKKFSFVDISEAMRSIGKTKEEDELNCGGCGYTSCRELAYAILNKKAEPSMCVSYMRKLATKKAATLLRTMPSGMVLTNDKLEIIETNDAFIETFMGDMAKVFLNRPDGLKGISLDRVVPFCNLFKEAFLKNSDIHIEKYPIKDKFYDITIFIIEPELITGAIITDVSHLA